MFEDDDKDEDTTEDNSSEDTTDEDTEESDNSESDEEDTEDESSDEDEEEEDEDTESDEDDSDDEGKALLTLDVTKYPKELQPLARKLVGIFTRNNQQAKLTIEKAEALDRLLADEDVKQLLQRKSSAVRGESLSKKSSKKSSKTRDDDEDEDIGSTIERLLDKKLGPYLKQQEQAQEQAKADAFKEKYPNWRIHYDDMVRIWKKPGYEHLDYEDCYKLARSTYRDKKLEKEERESKKRANVSKPNRTGAKGKNLEVKIDSVDDAYQLAKRMLNIGKKKGKR